MEWLIYTIIFMMGTVFGSFFTLAVYRIPLGIDIVRTHSFCPKCNHELGIIDLIPIVSYVSLGGRCRYCGENVRPRYLFLEVMSGLVFVLLALSMRIDFIALDLNKIIALFFMLLYIAFLFIIAGIDKENKQIHRGVLLYGISIACLFMIYACISMKQVIYTYIICLICMAIFLVIDAKILKKKLSDNYAIGILILSVIMIIFSGLEVFYYSVDLTLLLIAIVAIVRRIKDRSKKKETEKPNKEPVKIPIGFYLVVSNICIMIISNFLLIK